MNRIGGQHHLVHHPSHGAHHPNCPCPCHNGATNDFVSIRPAWNIRGDPRPNGPGIFSSPSSVNLTISNAPSNGRAKVRIHIGNNGHTTLSDTNDTLRGGNGVKRVHFDEKLQSQYENRWDKWPKRPLHSKPAPVRISTFYIELNSSHAEVRTRSLERYPRMLQATLELMNSLDLCRTVLSTSHVLARNSQYSLGLSLVFGGRLTTQTLTP